MRENTFLTDRVEYYDVLRIIATFAVVLIHVCAWFELHDLQAGVNYYRLCGDLVRWAVPIFVMISGALLLDSKRSIKQIYTKNILRIVTAFLFWSIIYALINNGDNAISLSILGTVLDGPGHLWFLYMIVGLYMIIPILSKVIDAEKTTLYFCALSFVFVFVLPSLLSAYAVLSGREASVITAKINTLNMYLPLGYSGYFVFGYYLSGHEIHRNVKIGIYVLAVLGICLTFFAHFYRNGDDLLRQIVKWDYLSPIVLIESTALFILCKDHIKIRRQRKKSLLSNISKCTFGVYLVHILVMNCFFDVIGITEVIGTSLISAFVISLLTFIVSLIISEIINKIPYINKFIV